MIVQKHFQEKFSRSTKGAFSGIFKVFGALFLVFPGIVARNLFGDALMSNPDNAYPYLVTEVLPKCFSAFLLQLFWGNFIFLCGGFKCNLYSIFARFYKPIINKKADDKQIARAGKTVTVIVGIISIIVAPFISFAPAGLYQFVQEFNGLYNMPLLVIILFAFYSKKQLLLEQK